MTQRIRRLPLNIPLALALLLIGGPAFAQEGYVLDGFGGVYAVNGASAISPATPYFGFDAAEAIQVLPDGAGYYVLDAFGGLHAGGNAPTPTSVPPYFGFDVARDMSLVPAPGPSLMFIASPGALADTNGNVTQFQPLFETGLSPMPIGAGVLFPVACTAGDLVATTSTATEPSVPRPIGRTEAATITVMVNETDTALSCTLTGGESQCENLMNTVNISRGDRVGYRIVYTNLDTAANGTFYLHKAFTCS